MQWDDLPIPKRAYAPRIGSLEFVSQKLGGCRLVHRLEPHDCIGDVLIASDLSPRAPRGPHSRCRRTASA